jgi:membrane protease YdiL (CAAX protease family)
MRDRNVASTLAGLTVAWGGVLLLVSPASRLLGPPDRLSTKLLAQLALWILAGLIVAIVIYWERQPLASLNLRPVRWSTVTWGLLLAVLMIYVVLPSLMAGLQLGGRHGQWSAFFCGVFLIAALASWERSGARCLLERNRLNETYNE